MNVNCNAMIALTSKLERLNKTAFPAAVRSSLSDCAFEMKKVNILASAEKNMVIRNKAFFKRYTGVKRATGNNVNSMYSEVGFQDRGEQKAKKAVNKGMEANEVGGDDGDGAMYMKDSRTSGSMRKGVRRNSRFNKSKIAKTKSNATFMQRAWTSLKDNAPVFIKTSKGNFLVQVTSMDKNAGKTDVKMKWLMRSRSKNHAHAHATHFVREAALVTQKMIPEFYLKNAEYQFNKVLKSTR